MHYFARRIVCTYKTGCSLLLKSYRNRVITSSYLSMKDTPATPLVSFANTMSTGITSNRTRLIEWSNDINKDIYKLVQHYTFNSPQGIHLFAQDEFPNWDFFNGRIKHWAVHSVHNDNKTIGYILLAPSKCIRDIIHVYTDIIVIPEKDADVPFLDTIVLLLQDAECLVRESGQHACIYESYIVNASLCEAVRDLDYNMLVSMPMSGHLGKLGWRESLVFMKELKHLRKHLEERSTLPHISTYEARQVESRRVQNMPRTVDIPDKFNHLRPLTIHYAHETELREIMDVFHHSAKEGSGVSLSDVPSEQFLLKAIRNSHPHHIFVVKSGDKNIGVGTIGPSEYARSSNPIVGDGVFMLKPEYTAGGLGIFPFAALTKIYGEAGYGTVLSDVFVCKPEAYLFLHSLGESSVLIAGRIPYAGRAGVSGWSDTHILYGRFAGVTPKL